MPEMYALVNGKPFKQDMALKLLVPNFPPIYNTDGTTIIPYTQEQTLNISSGFARAKNYYDTASNIYHPCYDILDLHINDAFKVAPSTNPPTVGWNTSMSLNGIFDQLMQTYGCLTSDAMCQNMMTFLSHITPRTCQNYSSSDRPTAKKLQSLRTSSTRISNCSWTSLTY